jgi:hypothetical protein
VQLGSRTDLKDCSSKCHCVLSHRCERPTNISIHAALPSHGNDGLSGPRSERKLRPGQSPFRVFPKLAKITRCPMACCCLHCYRQARHCTIATISRILSVHLTTTQLLNNYTTTRQLHDYWSTKELNYLTTTSPFVYKSVRLPQVQLATSPIAYESFCLQVCLTTTSPIVYKSNCLQVQLSTSPFAYRPT